MTYGKAVGNRRIRKSPFKWFAVHHDCHTPRPEWDTLARGKEEGGRGNNSNSNLAINSKHTWKTKRNPRSKSQHKSWVLRACHMREGERGEREGRRVEASARRQWVERQLWSCEYEWEWGSTPLGSINREHTLKHTRTRTHTNAHTHTHLRWQLSG